MAIITARKISTSRLDTVLIVWSFLLIERRLTVLVGHLLADLGDLGAHLEHDPLDAAPGPSTGDQPSRHVVLVVSRYDVIISNDCAS
jgi:hypothetical protein